MTQQEINTNLQGQIDELNRQITSLNNKSDVLDTSKFEDIKFFPLLKVDTLLTNRKWTDVSSSRAKDTVYQNGNNSIMVMATFKCAVSVAGGNAYAQAKSDSTATPTTVASGLVGIETGLLNENNTFQLVFVVTPLSYYKVVSSTTNGTVTLEKWFEISF